MFGKCCHLVISLQFLYVKRFRRAQHNRNCPGRALGLEWAGQEDARIEENEVAEARALITHKAKSNLVSREAALPTAGS